MNVKMRARLAADALRSSVRSRKRVDTEPSGLRWSHQPTRPTVSNRVSPFWHGKPHRLLVPRRREVRGTGTRGAKSHFFHRVAASVSWSNSGWLCCTYTTFFFLSLSLRVRCTGVRRLCAIVFCPAYVHVRKGVFAERERERESSSSSSSSNGHLRGCNTHGVVFMRAVRSCSCKDVSISKFALIGMFRVLFISAGIVTEIGLNL